MTYSTEKRTTDGTDVLYTGKLGYPLMIGFIKEVDAGYTGRAYSAEGGAAYLGKYRSRTAAKYAVIASFERLGGRLGEAA